MKLDKIFLIIVVNLFLSFSFYNTNINQVQLNLYLEDVHLSHTNGLESVNFDDLENKLTNLIPQTDFDCISVGIIRNNRLSWVNSFGSRPNNPNLIYGVASITKCFTATAILQLYDRNLLNLFENVSNYLPFQLRNPNFQNTQLLLKCY